MLALNQRALVYRREGWRGGQPDYSQDGAELRCRIQAKDGRGASRGGFDRSGSAMIIAEEAAVAAGDRIRLPEGAFMTVRAVRVVRGYDRVHHLEIEAGPEA